MGHVPEVGCYLVLIEQTVGMILQHVCLFSLHEALKCYVCSTDLCCYFWLLGGRKTKAISLIWVVAQTRWEVLVCTLNQTFSEEDCPLECSRKELASFTSHLSTVESAGSKTVMPIYLPVVWHITEDCNVHIYCLENLWYQNQMFFVLIVCFIILEEMDLSANCIPW